MTQDVYTHGEKNRADPEPEIGRKMTVFIFLFYCVLRSFIPYISTFFGVVENAARRAAYQLQPSVAGRSWKGRARVRADDVFFA